MPNPGPPDQEVKLLGAYVDNRTRRHRPQGLNHQPCSAHIMRTRPEGRKSPSGEVGQQRDPPFNLNPIVSPCFVCGSSDCQTHDAPGGMHSYNQTEPQNSLRLVSAVVLAR